MGKGARGVEEVFGFHTGFHRGESWVPAAELGSWTSGEPVLLGEVGGAVEMSSSRAGSRGGRCFKRRKESRKKMSIASTKDVGV